MHERELMVKLPSGRVVNAGKIIAISGEWCYYRQVQKRIHLLRKFNAWSLQASILPVLEKDKVKWIYQYDKETGQMMRISLKDFKAKSVERNFGQGKQLYVSDKYFEPVNMAPIRNWVNDSELIA